VLSAVLILSDGNTTELLFIFRIIYFKFSFIFGELFRLWLIVVVPVSSLLVQPLRVLANSLAKQRLIFYPPDVRVHAAARC